MHSETKAALFLPGVHVGGKAQCFSERHTQDSVSIRHLRKQLHLVTLLNPAHPLFLPSACLDPLPE